MTTPLILNVLIVTTKRVPLSTKHFNHWSPDYRFDVYIGKGSAGTPPPFYAIKGSSGSPSSLRAVAICILNCCECPLLTMGWRPPALSACNSACSGDCSPLRRSISSSRCECLCLLWDSDPFVVVSSACYVPADPLSWEGPYIEQLQIMTWDTHCIVRMS